MGMTYEQFEFQNLAWTLQNFNRNYHILVASDKICRKEYRSEIKLARVKKDELYEKYALGGITSEEYQKIQRMVPKINLEQIKGFIEEVPFIIELQKTFYKRYITARFEQILKPAYDMVMSEKQELSEPNMTM